MTLPSNIKRRDRTALRTGCAVALWPSDTSCDYELERAPDSAGSPDTGSSVTLGVVPGTSETYFDPRPTGSGPWWYRVRSTAPGHTASGWTDWVSIEPQDVAGYYRPDPILPSVQERPTDDGATGTLTLEVVDPQNRLSKVEFKKKSGSASEEASWSEDASEPYSYDVDLSEKHPSHIRYRVTYYDDKGNEATRERTVSFGLATKPAKPSVSLALAANGDVTAHVEGDVDTAEVKAAGSTSSYPSQATVDAESPIAGNSVDTGVLVNLDSGDTAYVSVRAYNASGVGSELAKVKLTAISEELNDPPDDVSAVTLSADAEVLDVRDRNYTLDAQLASITLTATLTYPKDSLFKAFEYRIWQQGEDEEDAAVQTAIGKLVSGNDYTFVAHHARRADPETTWYIEVRVLNTDGQFSANWVQDSVTPSLVRRDVLPSGPPPSAPGSVSLTVSRSRIEVFS